VECWYEELWAEDSWGMNKRALALCDGGCGRPMAGIWIEILLVRLSAIDGG
jgi:hypothetical protein